MSLSRFIVLLTATAMSLGCISLRRRPPSHPDAIRKPTIWDHLISDRNDERDEIASRLKREENSLFERKVSMLRRIREHELEAQLSPRDAEQDVHRKSVAKLKSETRITDRELERVTAKQKQNEHDRSYWPNRAAYRKPTASPIEPMVETPVRTSTPTFNNR